MVTKRFGNKEMDMKMMKFLLKFEILFHQKSLSNCNCKFIVIWEGTSLQTKTNSCKIKSEVIIVIVMYINDKSVSVFIIINYFY